MAGENPKSQAAAASAFFADGRWSGGIYYFQRDRQRVDGNPAEAIKSGRYQSNLSHTTVQPSVNFSSGYAWDTLGADLGGYYAYDLAVDATNPVNQENEFSFAGDRWGEDYRNGAPANGFSLSNAALKLRFKEGKITLKGGLTPLSIPGIIGVNWSYQPGSYEGAQIEGRSGPWYLTYAWADRYKAPWFRQTQVFSKAKAWMDPFADKNKIAYIHALAARYSFADGTAVTAAVGQSAGYLTNSHFKAARQWQVLGGLSSSYQLYTSASQDDTYSGLAWQQALTLGWSLAPYGFRLESLWTHAAGAEGNYLPRLTRGYANSQGASEIWWDARSDWNANHEKALYFGVTRQLQDWLKSPGWTIGLAGVYGWDMEKGDGSKASNGEDSERACNFDLSYSEPQGALKGATFKLHFTVYRNAIPESGGWTEYPNVFASERDVKLYVTLPLGG